MVLNSPYTGNSELDAFLSDVASSIGEGTGGTVTVSGNQDPTNGNSVGYLKRYIHIKYADNNTGSGFSNLPANKTYYGIYNSDTATESTNPADYNWYLTTGFGNDKKLWYSIIGGRQIKFAVSILSPGTKWIFDTGTAIDLDNITIDSDNLQPDVLAVGKLLTVLEGSITESQLFTDLGSRINLIDGPSTLTNSVNSRVAAEATARANAIAAEATARASAIAAEASTRSTQITAETTARTNAINNEASARAQAILDEASARSTADGALQTQIDLLSAAGSGDFTELLAAVQEEQTARIAADAAEATSREALAAQVRGDYTGTDPSQLTTGLVYNERQTRVTAEEAISTSVSSLQSTVNTNLTNTNAAIASEQTTRANADTALATSITNLTSTVSTNLTNTNTAITNEQTARANADSALAEDISVLESTVTSNDTAVKALITSEASTRATQDSVLATSINTLTSTVTSNDTAVKALITSEASTRSTADTALANDISTLQSTVTSNDTAVRALVTSEATTRSDADTALSTNIATLQTTVNTNLTNTNAAIVTEQNTRAGADTALATSINALSSTVDTNLTNTNAAITAESETRATADTSLATSINTLSSTVGTNLTNTNAAITAEASTRATADTALATDITTLSSTVTNNYNTLDAAITTEATTRSTNDAAITSSVTTLSSTVDANTTAIQSEASTRATETGNLFSKYTVKIDTNGYVSGFGLASTANNDTPFSDFIIRADKFAIASPAGPGITPSVPFIVYTTPTVVNGITVQPGVYIKSANIETITADKIAANAITANKIAADAITAEKIAANTITGDKIVANTIDASKINSNGLDVRDSTGKIILSAGTFPGVASLSTNANLVQGFSSWANYGSNTVIQNQYTAENGSVLVIPSGSNFQSSNSPALNLASGTYTVSFKAALTSGSPRVLELDLFPDTLPGSNVTVVAGWNDYQVTWTSSHPDLANCILRFFANSVAGQIEIADVKIEAGNKRTLWTPHKLDFPSVNNRISSTNASTYIADLAVNTLQIANQAVTIPLSANTAAGVTIVKNSYTSLQSITYTATGAPVVILVSYDAASSPRTYTKISRNGTQLYLKLTFAAAGSGPFQTAFITDTPPAGAVTYLLEAMVDSLAGANTDVISNRRMFVMETKK